MGDVAGGHGQVAIEYHPRSPDASLERLRTLSGVIRLKGKAPSHKFLLQTEEEAGQNGRAGN